MKTNVTQKKDNLTTFIAKDFKELVIDEILKLEKSEIIDLEIFYKNYVIVISAYVSYDYIDNSFYHLFGVEYIVSKDYNNVIITKLFIAYHDDCLDITKVELDTIINFLNK